MEILNNKEQIDSYLLNNPNCAVLFSSTWCPPCKMLKPILMEFSENNPQYNIVIMNTDEAVDVRKEQNIFNIPSLVLYKDSSQEKVLEGFIQYEEIEEAFSEVYN